MSFGKSLNEFTQSRLAPPKYLSLPTAGIEISAGAIKVVTIREKSYGLELESFKEIRLPAGVSFGGKITDKDVVAQLLSNEVFLKGIHLANTTISESNDPLFVSTTENGSELSTDEVEYEKQIIDDSVALFEDAGIQLRAIESAASALPRALLKEGDTETVMIIDIGKTSTKFIIASGQLPRFATILNVGGHAITLAVQKYFGVTEEEAKKIKVEKGIVPSPSDDEYITALVSIISTIRREALRRIDYWDSRKATVPSHASISRVILVGGNASVRGLREYFETALRIPVQLGDVFSNFASRTHWLPPMDYTESLGFGTAIGLALREYVS